MGEEVPSRQKGNSEEVEFYIRAESPAQLRGASG